MHLMPPSRSKPHPVETGADIRSFFPKKVSIPSDIPNATPVDPSEPLDVFGIEFSQSDSMSLPDAVTSPHWPATAEASSSGLVPDNSIGDGSGSEVSVSAGDELPADRDIYIPVYSTVETSEAPNDSTSWFCRSKKTVQTQIRRFYLTGRCVWNKEIIEDEGRLAAVFNSQAIALSLIHI